MASKNILIKKIRGYLNKLGKCIVGEGTVLYPQSKIIKNSGGNESIRVDENTHIRGELFTFGHGGEIKIGSFCYIGEGTRIWSSSSVTIGDRVLIGQNVNIFDSNTHPISPNERHQHFKDIIAEGFPKISDLREKPVVISDDVFIGCMAVKSMKKEGYLVFSSNFVKRLKKVQ